MRLFLRSKIHKARVTEANVNYVGSITIDESLLIRAKIDEYEKVLVVNNTNGNRFETYVINGSKDSGVVCINGAAAHLAQAGDEVIIMSFHLVDKATEPLMILLDEKNKFVKYLICKNMSPAVLKTYGK